MSRLNRAAAALQSELRKPHRVAFLMTYVAGLAVFAAVAAITYGMMLIISQRAAALLTDKWEFIAFLFLPVVIVATLILYRLHQLHDRTWDLMMHEPPPRRITSKHCGLDR